MGGTKVRLVLATHNPSKREELFAILEPSVEALSAADIGSAAELGVPDVVEDGASFAHNALIKARAVAAATGLVAVADDSGLSVDILGGSPGIFSARWCGRHGDDQGNRSLLLAQLRDINAPHRGASFVCAAALVVPNGPEIVEYGELRGELTMEERGTQGFGYDSIFQPENDNRTTAEMNPEEKNAISHRGNALRALAPHIAQALSS